MNRNDRRIAIVAIFVILIALVLLFLTDCDDATTIGKSGAKDSISNYYSNDRSSYSNDSYGALPQRHIEEFPFDPNTADSVQLQRLGLQKWQIRNIYRYRARGGVYKKKEDFARLYGLTIKDYRRLEPYIQISDDYKPAATLVDDRPSQRDTLRYPVKLNEGEFVVLNTADTTQLKKVPGIGSYYAKEIVRHGKWLGGYVSVNQLDEIDNFPSSAKKYFVISNPRPQRLAINRLTLQELRRHPYINYYQAKAIIDYRRLRGNIHSLQELRLSKDFPPEAIARLEPYIEY